MFIKFPPGEGPEFKVTHEPLKIDKTPEGLHQLRIVAQALAKAQYIITTMLRRREIC